MSWIDSYFDTTPTSVAMAGDVTGTTGASVVSSFSGASVPGAALANQFLVAASPTNMTWRALSDSDIPNFAGDVGGSIGATEVHSIGTSAPSGIIAVHSSTLKFDLGTTPLLTIADINGPGGPAFTIRGQNNTAGGLSIGGDLNLSAGSGTSQSGSVNLQIAAGTNVLTVQGSNGQTNLGVGNRGVLVGASTSHIGFFGLSPQAKPSITGMLSAVIDVNVKNVLTSVVGALKDAAPGLGLWTDSTT